MCKASIDDPDAPDLTKGDVFDVGVNEYGMGTANRRDQSNNGKEGATSCLACLHTGAEFTMSNIADEVREALDLDETETAVFIETPGDDDWIIHDLVAIKGRPELGQMPFALFAGAIGTVTVATAQWEVTGEEAIGEAEQVVFTGETPMQMLRRIAEEAEDRAVTASYYPEGWDSGDPDDAAVEEVRRLVDA